MNVWLIKTSNRRLAVYVLQFFAHQETELYVPFLNKTFTTKTFFVYYINFRKVNSLNAEAKKYLLINSFYVIKF